VETIFPQIIDGKPFWADESTKPVVRTYTLRSIDLTKGELAIDFVLHGDNGPASAWAGNVAVGDYLGIGIRPGKILPKADWYLFSGDETATPAISAMLEALPEEADGIALLEVGSAADIMEISTKSKVVIRWFSRNDEPAEESDLLLNVIKDLPSLSAGFQSRYIWAAGESAAIKTIRGYANENLEIAPGELSAKAYWTAGISEDDFRRLKNKE
jgi:NADPH-dependent ferric siderophore reductase